MMYKNLQEKMYGQLKDVFGKRGESRDAWIAFLLAFLPRLIFVFTSTYPVSIGGDEIFQFMPIAELLGWDWSGVAESYRYYGYGFFILLTPLFKLISNPLILYRCIVLILAMVQAMVAPLTYRILKDTYQIKDKWFLILSAEVCSYFVTVRAVYTYNEHVYVFVIWLIAAALLTLEKNIDDQKGKRKWTFIVMLLMVYAMTLHSRAVALWIAFAAGVVIYYIAYHKWVISWGVFAGVGILGYAGTELFKKLIINACVIARAGTVDNASVSFDISSLFYSGKSLLGWIYIIVGQLSSLAVFTGGFAIFCLVVCVYKLFATFFKCLFPKYNQGEDSKLDSKSFFLLTVMLIAVVITILGQSVSWLWGVVEGLEADKVVDSYRAFTYLRYYAAYFGPVLMLGLVWLKEGQQVYCRCIEAIIGISWLLQLVWYAGILPHISTYAGTVWDYAPYSMTRGWTDEISKTSYIAAAAFVIMLSCIMYFLILHKKGTIIIGFLACLLLYEYCYNAVYHEGWRGKENYEAVYESCQVMNALIEQDVLPDEIYVEKVTHPVTEQGIGYIYQFMLPRQRIIYHLPKSDEETDTVSVVLTIRSKLNKTLVNQGYWCMQLGERQYIYAKGEKLQQALVDMGMTRLY